MGKWGSLKKKSLKRELKGTSQGAEVKEQGGKDMKNIQPEAEKRPKVALISSTKAAFGPMEAAFAEIFPEAQIMHILDETLLEDFRREGGLSPHSRAKALQMALTAQRAGVEGILFTCSTLSPAVDDLEPFISVPLVKIDEPVISYLVQNHRNIGLLATAETVLKSVENQVKKRAEKLGRPVSLSFFIEGEAWPLLAKSPAAFYKALGAFASQAAMECEVLLLTQVSIAPARDFVEEKIRTKIFASPSFAVRALREILS